MSDSMREWPSEKPINRKAIISDQSYPDLTPQELDALSEKLTDEFLKDEQGLLSGCVANNRSWTSEIREFSLDEIDHIIADGMDNIYGKPKGIHVTSIVPPEHGWPIAFHCSICKETIFLLSTWANKPEKGDYYKMNDVCASDEQSYAHNLKMAMKLPPAYMKY